MVSAQHNKKIYLLGKKKPSNKDDKFTFELGAAAKGLSPSTLPSTLAEPAKNQSPSPLQSTPTVTHELIPSRRFQLDV